MFFSRILNALLSLSEMWYWIFLWALFSSLFVHGAAGVLMFVMLQRHRQGRVISVIAVSIGFLASVTGAMITSAAVAGIYRVAGKNMAPLEALVWGVGQTVLTLIISFSRILATLWGFCGTVLLHLRKQMYRFSENSIVNKWEWNCARMWKEQVETWGLALRGKTALWCSSDCTTALHLTCLRPRPGASHPWSYKQKHLVQLPIRLTLVLTHRCAQCCVKLQGHFEELIYVPNSSFFFLTLIMWNLQV